jgi:hypothetical protein
MRIDRFHQCNGEGWRRLLRHKPQHSPTETENTLFPAVTLHDLNQALSTQSYIN